MPFIGHFTYSAYYSNHHFIHKFPEKRRIQQWHSTAIHSMSRGVRPILVFSNALPLFSLVTLDTRMLKVSEYCFNPWVIILLWVLTEITYAYCQLLVNTEWWETVTIIITLFSFLNPHSPRCPLLMRPYMTWMDWRISASEFPAAHTVKSAAWTLTVPLHSLSSLCLCFSALLSTSTFQPLRCALFGIMWEAGKL